MLELDTWNGALFDPNRLDDPNETGVTVIKRNKDSLFELTKELERTELFWSIQNQIKTFQVEEISETENVFGHYHFNKYLHSERDIHKKQFIHFDGAVKVYLSDSYKSRYESIIPKHAKAHKKTKLFRIDGSIELQTWIDLICLFYKGNEMIIKYFNPEQFDEIFEERVRDFNNWKAKQVKQK